MRRSRNRQAARDRYAVAAELVPDLSVAEPRVRIGDVLVHSGVIARDALEVVTPHVNGQRLGTVLIERGMVAEDDVTRALSEQLHVPVVDLRDAAPEADATALIEPHDAHEHDVLPLIVSDGTLTVAVADPLDTDVMRLLQSLPVSEVHVALGVPTQLRNRVNQTYSALSAVGSDIEAFQATDIGDRDTGHDRRGRRRARADRPDRQQDRHPGAARPRLRRAHRAGRGLRAGAVPHRRRAEARSSSCRRRWARRSSAASRSWPT